MRGGAQGNNQALANENTLPPHLAEAKQAPRARIKINKI